ncbi:MAG: hypothetical protein NTZ49_04790 [Candidatus Parcubacteria bacterium]|nr:hypothetical protein [Candidatus Parcubacteria bacterium]
MKLIKVNIVAYDSFKEVNHYNPDNHVGDYHYIGIDYAEKHDWRSLSLSINYTLTKYKLIPNDGEEGKKGSWNLVGLRDAWIEGDDLCLLWRKRGPSGKKIIITKEAYKDGKYHSSYPYNPPKYYSYEVDVYAYHNYIIRINLLNFVWDSNFFCQSKTEDKFMSVEAIEASMQKIPLAKTLAKHQDAKFALFHGVKIPIASWTPQIREYEIPKKVFNNLVLFCQGKAQLSAIGNIEPLKF